MPAAQFLLEARPAGQVTFDDGECADVECGFELTISGVEMRRNVIVEKHSNQYSVERADRRHSAMIFAPDID